MAAFNLKFVILNTPACLPDSDQRDQNEHGNDGTDWYYVPFDMKH